MLHSPKRQVFLEFLVAKKAFYFSKRALLAGTARNKWLEKALHTLLVVPETKMFTSNIFELFFHFNRNQWRKIKNTISASTDGWSKWWSIKFMWVFIHKINPYYLTVFWCFQGVEKRCIKNEWVNQSILYPLKTSENLRFSDILGGYRKGRLIWNGIILWTLEIFQTLISFFQ